jgi:hypothetical protein
MCFHPVLRPISGGSARRRTPWRSCSRNLRDYCTCIRFRGLPYRSTWCLDCIHQFVLRDGTASCEWCHRGDVKTGYSLDVLCALCYAMALAFDHSDRYAVRTRVALVSTHWGSSNFCFQCLKIFLRHVFALLLRLQTNANPRCVGGSSTPQCQKPRCKREKYRDRTT